MNRQAEIKAIIDEGYAKGVFPLQTHSTLAKRWGVSQANVHMWILRDDKFPKPLEGILAKMERGGVVYALCDVKSYEREKGLVVNV